MGLEPVALQTGFVILAQTKTLHERDRKHVGQQSKLCWQY